MSGINWREVEAARFCDDAPLFDLESLKQLKHDTPETLKAVLALGEALSCCCCMRCALSTSGGSERTGEVGTGAGEEGVEEREIDQARCLLRVMGGMVAKAAAVFVPMPSRFYEVSRMCEIVQGVGHEFKPYGQFFDRRNLGEIKSHHTLAAGHMFTGVWYVDYILESCGVLCDATHSFVAVIRQTNTPLEKARESRGATEPRSLEEFRRSRERRTFPMAAQVEGMDGPSGAVDLQLCMGFGTCTCRRCRGQFIMTGHEQHMADMLPTFTKKRRAAAYTVHSEDLPFDPKAAFDKDGNGLPFGDSNALVSVNDLFDRGMSLVSLPVFVLLRYETYPSLATALCAAARKDDRFLTHYRVVFPVTGLKDLDETVMPVLLSETAVAAAATCGIPNADCLFAPEDPMVVAMKVFSFLAEWERKVDAGLRRLCALGNLPSFVFSAETPIVSDTRLLLEAHRCFTQTMTQVTTVACVGSMYAARYKYFHVKPLHAPWEAPPTTLLFPDIDPVEESVAQESIVFSLNPLDPPPKKCCALC
jgi:hypothetical protein